MIHSSPITSLHPLITTHENMEKFRAAAEWVVEIGDQTQRHLWNEWKTEFKDRFLWIDSHNARRQSYGDVDLTGKKLLVKCDFLKVNNHVLMVFQPFGRFSAYSEMESYIQKCLGSPGSSITDVSNFSDNLIWKELEENSSPSETDTFPYGAKSAVCVESDYHLNKFVQEAKTLYFKKKNISCIRLPYSDVKEYAAEENKPVPLLAWKGAALINGFVVAFLNRGLYCDRIALQNKAKEWFPNHKQFVTEEELSNFLRVIGKPEFSPSLYQRLVKEIDSQPVLIIDSRKLSKNDAPDIVVSSQTELDDMLHESYYKQIDSRYQSPSKVLTEFYLIPRANLFKKYFSEMVDKMKASQKKGLTGEIKDILVSADLLSGWITVVLNIKGSGEYICLDRDMNDLISKYCGNLQNLVNMLDAVTENFDIEKFQPDDRVSFF